MYPPPHTHIYTNTHPSPPIKTPRAMGNATPSSSDSRFPCIPPPSSPNAPSAS